MGKFEDIEATMYGRDIEEIKEKKLEQMVSVYGEIDFQNYDDDSGISGGEYWEGYFSSPGGWKFVITCKSSREEVLVGILEEIRWEVYWKCQKIEREKRDNGYITW